MTKQTNPEQPAVRHISYGVDFPFKYDIFDDNAWHSLFLYFVLFEYI